MRCWTTIVAGIALVLAGACGGGDGDDAGATEPECLLAAQLVARAQTVDGIRKEIDRQLARDDISPEQRRYFEALRDALVVAPENSDIGDTVEVVPCPT